MTDKNYKEEICVYKIEAEGMPSADVGLAGPEQATPGGTQWLECPHCLDKRACRSSVDRHCTRAGVRVSIDLHHFYTDRRSRVFMWAPYGRCVQWLAQRVARGFQLPTNIALLCRGHLLPLTEPLLMLDPDDSIEIVSTSEELGTIHQAHRDFDAPSEGLIVSEREEISRPNADVPSPTARHKDHEECEKREQDEERLRQLKRRALLLLDERYAPHEGDDRYASREGDEHALEIAPAKRARRRRRRRAPASHFEAEGEAENGDEDPCGDAGVVRGGSGSRPPRLVRALSPAGRAADDVE